MISDTLGNFSFQVINRQTYRKLHRLTFELAETSFMRFVDFKKARNSRFSSSTRLTARSSEVYRKGNNETIKR